MEQVPLDVLSSKTSIVTLVEEVIETPVAENAPTSFTVLAGQGFDLMSLYRLQLQNDNAQAQEHQDAAGAHPSRSPSLDTVSWQKPDPSTYEYSVDGSPKSSSDKYYAESTISEVSYTSSLRSQRKEQINAQNARYFETLDLKDVNQILFKIYFNTQHLDEDDEEAMAFMRESFDEIAPLLDEKPLPCPHVDSFGVMFDVDDEIRKSRRGTVFSLRQDASLPRRPSVRKMSLSSVDSDTSTTVDWEELGTKEKQQVRNSNTDESTAFLLARLERENAALASDPKAGQAVRPQSSSRAPSFGHLKQLVKDANRKLRNSQLPRPPLTELEFWSALVRDYSQTAHRLPTLTSRKIRGGIPPPLRGVVWQAITGARSSDLEEYYDKFSNETSPYESIIVKDVGRSFPNVDMFKQPNGDGQRMLGSVLNAFSIWDKEIGYCQGLGFVVGPLIMHMGDKEAFCVLVRLMQHYNLRSCFLPDLYGLHLRIFQFQNLLKQHLPILTQHLESLNVEPLYLSQWFLSFFGVTCPLPMLVRIYDVLLTEGASETLMRVALSIMRRNEARILALSEFDEVMSLLISNQVWETYDFDGDELVNDFCGWTGLVTRKRLDELEEQFRSPSRSAEMPKASYNSTASRIFGRFWANSDASSKGTLPSPTDTVFSSDSQNFLNRQESTIFTVGSMSVSQVSLHSALSEQEEFEKELPAIDYREKALPIPVESLAPQLLTSTTGTDRSLHDQIEDLLHAMGDLQKRQLELAQELQVEREQREEDKEVIRGVLDRLKSCTLQVPDPAAGQGTAAEQDICEAESFDNKPDLKTSAFATGESLQIVNPEPMKDIPIAADIVRKIITDLEVRFLQPTRRPSVAIQTKQELRAEADRMREQLSDEAAKTLMLQHQISDNERETCHLREQLREARATIQASQRDKGRLEKQNLNLRISALKTPLTARPELTSNPSQMSVASSIATIMPSNPRELDLDLRHDDAQTPAEEVLSPLSLTSSSDTSPKATQKGFFGKLSSSLSSSGPSSTNSPPPPPPKDDFGDFVGTQFKSTKLNDEDQILIELASAKTSEALARQELEETRAKLESLRRLVGQRTNSTSGSPGTDRGESAGAAFTRLLGTPTGSIDTSSGTGAGSGYFFTNWGKRTTSGSS